MSELKAYRVKGVTLGDTHDVYIKEEADKVIKELKKEKEYVIENTAEVINAQEREIRHQKYKRCLAMAERCAWKQRFWGDGIPAYERQFQWENRAAKWKKRWLKIAKQFKES